MFDFLYFLKWNGDFINFLCLLFLLLICVSLGFGLNVLMWEGLLFMNRKIMCFVCGVKCGCFGFIGLLDGLLLLYVLVNVVVSFIILKFVFVCCNYLWCEIFEEINCLLNLFLLFGIYNFYDLWCGWCKIVFMGW